MLWAASAIAFALLLAVPRWLPDQWGGALAALLFVGVQWAGLRWAVGPAWVALFRRPRWRDVALGLAAVPLYFSTLLRQLNNVEDGNYYVVMYDGNAADSNGYLYAATATEGDGFDFAEVDGDFSGYDTDTVELIGVFNQVGGNAFTSLNFVDTTAPG